jgi:hypothetical protein
LVPGELPQPRIEGDGLIAEVLVQSAVGKDQRFLHDIGGVDTLLQAVIHADGKHATETIAVSVEELIAGLVVAIGRAGQERRGVV